MDVIDKDRETQVDKHGEHIRFLEGRSPYYEAAQKIADEFSLKRKEVSCSVVIVR